MGETWGQTGRTPFLQVHVCDEKLVNVPSVPMFFVPRGIQVGHAAQQNLGDSFPVFDNFDFETGEGTQIYSTTQIQTTQQLIAAIRAKASQFQQGFDSANQFIGKDSAGNRVVIDKPQVTTRNMLVVTPQNRNFPLSRIATELEQLEGEFGLDEIVVEESAGLNP
jgi:hypothetical protein